MTLPRWATAPTKTAKATAKGWVENTGELLVSHKGLDAKIEALNPKKAPKKAPKVEVAEEISED